MNRKKLLLAFAFALFTFVGCRKTGPAPENQMLKETRLLLGTMIEITIRGEKEVLARKAIEQAFREVEKIDDLMSPFKEDSDISRLNREGDRKPIKVSQDTFQVVRESLRLSELSDGAFDITIVPLLHLWDSARKNKRLPEEGELKEALALVNYGNILLDEGRRTVRFREKGMNISLGGIAKGYAVDKAIENLKHRGIKRAIVDAGGDLYLLGRPFGKDFWDIGIRHPRKRGEILGVIKARDEAMATSGDYEKYFILDGKRYSHLLDPHTGKPVEGMLSVTVLAEDALRADGLATAIFVLGAEKGLELANRLEGVEAIIISRDSNGRMIILTTEGLKDRLSLD